MKKTILATLFVFVLIFGADSYGAQVVLPDMNAKLSETVDIEPVLEQVTVIKPFEYQIRRGDNLTKLAKTFGITIDQLLAYNPNIKDKNLIFRGSKLVVPLYSAKSMDALASLYGKERASVENAYDQGQKSMFGYVSVLVLGFLVILFFFVIAFLKNNDLKSQVTEAEDKLKTLEQAFAHVHVQLSLANEQLKLKEGADEEISRQKQENDRLVERVSTLYMDNEMISVNLAEARAKIEALERKVRLMPDQFVELESQEHGKISVKILKLEASKGKEGELDVFVECPKNGCLVNVAKSLKDKNALSHIANSNHWPEK